ncbi:hypothetical protein [Janibacter sp. GXQ6167]|uniref:hypothetical protein n=1 Tax=Janibacter sp. GXQ6167 TaxID=3240791 RepID=UPI0035269B40
MVIAVAVIALIVAVRSSSPDDVAAETPSTYTETMTETATVEPTTESTTITPEEEALDSLQSQREASLSGLDLDSRWVAVLSAKYDGVSDPLQQTSSGSHTWYLPDIVELNDSLVEQMDSQGVSTLVLLATDFGRDTNSNSNEIWMTIADPGGLYSSEDVTSWCESQFPGQSGEELLNSCLPRQLRP